MRDILQWAGRLHLDRLAEDIEGNSSWLRSVKTCRSTPDWRPVPLRCRDAICWVAARISPRARAGRIRQFKFGPEKAPRFSPREHPVSSPEVLGRRRGARPTGAVSI